MSQLLPNVTIRKKIENRGHLPASASPVLGGNSDAGNWGALRPPVPAAWWYTGDWGALRLPVPAAWWHTGDWGTLRLPVPLGSVYSRGDTQATQGLSCFPEAQHLKPCSLGQALQSAVAWG